ncbi:MAG: septation protein SpoVG family protein [Candidatus Omnitrophota bacterium]
MGKVLEIKVEKFYHLDNGSAVKAFADVSIGNSFVIKGVRVVSGKNGLFVSMPRQQGKDGKWYSRVYFTNDALKDELNEVVLSEFNG